MDPSIHRPTSYHPDSVQAAAKTPEPKAKTDEPSLPEPTRKFDPVAPDYHKEKRSKSRWIIIGVAVLIAAAAYWFLFRSKPAKAPTVANSSSSNSSQSSSASDSTTHYDSTNFNLGFDYPKDWKVDDTGSGKLTVTSPTTKLKNTDGQQVDGQIVMAIRNNTQKLSEFDKGSATAVLNSQQITYAKPTKTQRASTNISFLNYASSSSSTGLDGIYITGINSYQKKQAVLQTDIAKADPLIDINFLKGTTPTTIAASSWSDSSFSKPLKTMLESLAIQ